ncbi:DUF6153 family protein [Actinocrispum wychmicini]|uniref:Secreted protein n=1 Tax=Actinocrispum wychmicini TaxID=1213861 RepID=A0A4R2J728_9PSEU|nr:DUF6153 family protein [Actinocrispum wychmicini]TCO54871.1 hypothetical protein EV192_108159 [Actinocrispum wychmicini]
MHRTVPARAIARLLTVTAVLAGLFAMHGLPAQACPGGAGAVMSEAMSADATSHHATPTSGDAAAPAMSGHGSVCAATLTPRGSDTSSGVTPVLVTSTPPTRTVHPRRPRDRGPPLAKADLLTTLCVSRT